MTGPWTLVVCSKCKAPRVGAHFEREGHDLIEVDVIPVDTVRAALDADLISDGARINRIREALGV